jgi:hypothetical protein
MGTAGKTPAVAVGADSNRHKKDDESKTNLIGAALVQTVRPELRGSWVILASVRNATMDGLNLLETDPVTGRRTGMAVQAAKALRALKRAKVPHAVIGAAALAARGLPRMTTDLDIVVVVDNALPALDALEAAGFRSVTPVRRKDDPEPMYVLRGNGGEVDLLVAAGEPETTVIGEATPARLFGTTAPVATLEHLLLLYLYSNQPRHLGDFARIVTETNADLGKVVRFLEDVHPEMLTVFRDRVRVAKNPPPPPPRPKPRT